jgi:hypothetical protein
LLPSHPLTVPLEEAWAFLGSHEESHIDTPRTAVERPKVTDMLPMHFDVHELRRVIVEVGSYDIVQKECRVQPRGVLSQVSRIDYEYLPANQARCFDFRSRNGCFGSRSSECKAL